MAEVVRKDIVSDVSGQLVPEGEAWRAHITHPEDGETRRIDLSPEEADALRKLGSPAIRIALVEPGEEVSEEEFYVPPAKLDGLFKPMGKKAVEILVAAPVVGRRRSANGGGDTGRNYASPEWAGEPKKGKTSPEERAFVHDNLRQVNARLEAQGKRTIDLSDPRHVERYGLQDLAEAAKANGGVLPEHLGGPAPATPEAPAQ